MEGENDSFRDSVSTIGKDGKRVWVYPNKPNGRYYRLRTYFSYLFLASLFLLPFIKVSGEPLFLFNVLERKFILFGMVFWPQDFFLFGLAMLTFMVFIVLFTAVFGRLWCGWACPQTIFMEMVFRKLEYLIEGDGPYQKTLDKMPWNSEKIIKRTIKYLSFYAVSFLISLMFLSYIIGLDEVLLFFTQSGSHKKGLISLFIFSGVFFFVYIYLREQVCIVVCPYGRLQGVLLDKRSIVVAYDYQRGEPRSLIHKNEQRTAGDCIDCGHCVKVCPTGIDIRNGTQMECVNCTACIDSCDEMMEKVGFEKGLVRYASEAGIMNKEKVKITPRIIGYSVILLILASVLTFALVGRSDVETTILRTPGMLYQDRGDGLISNLYNYKIVNKTRNEMEMELRIESIKGSINLIGRKNIFIKKEEVTEGEFFILIEKKDLMARKTKIKIGIYSNNKLIDDVQTNFVAPVKTRK